MHSQHSGDSRKLATPPLSLGAVTATSRSGVPGLQLNPLEKLDAPALCVNTTDPAATLSSLDFGKSGTTVTFQILMKLQHHRHLNKDP